MNDTSIHIHPLRERVEDISELIHHFILIICEDYDLPVKEIDYVAVSMMLKYDWPGNTRELKHKLQELIIYHDGNTIDTDDIIEWMNITSEEYGEDTLTTNSKLRNARQNFEREHIQKTLIAYNWNVPAAANALGIERTNLYRKMKQLGITKENQKVED